MKQFQSDLYKIHFKLLNKEPFAFVRYSDGELFLMQGQKVELKQDKSIIGNVVYEASWGKEDFKCVDPKTNPQIQQDLIDSFRYNMPNYFKGISCRCCVGDKNRDFFNSLAIESDCWTWANLFVNNNYIYYLKYLVPLLLNHPKIVLVSNENSNTNLIKPFKWFKVGENCIVNNYSLKQEIVDWVNTNKIVNTLFLFSASSLSQICIHELHRAQPLNTYINIGTTLNHLLGLPCNRGYLSIHNNQNHPDLQKVCIW